MTANAIHYQKIQYKLEMLIFFDISGSLFLIELSYNVCHNRLYDGNNCSIFIKKVWDCFHIMVIGVLRCVCTTGVTCRTTFGIPGGLFNITIDHILRKNVTVQTVFGIVTAVTIFKNICGIEWDIL